MNILFATTAELFLTKRENCYELLPGTRENKRGRELFYQMLHTEVNLELEEYLASL